MQRCERARARNKRPPTKPPSDDRAKGLGCDPCSRLRHPEMAVQEGLACRAAGANGQGLGCQQLQSCLWRTSVEPLRDRAAAGCRPARGQGASGPSLAATAVHQLGKPRGPARATEEGHVSQGNSCCSGAPFASTPGCDLQPSARKCHCVALAHLPFCPQPKASLLLDGSRARRRAEEERQALMRTARESFTAQVRLLGGRRWPLALRRALLYSIFTQSGLWLRTGRADLPEGLRGKVHGLWRLDFASCTRL